MGNYSIIDLLKIQKEFTEITEAEEQKITGDEIVPGARIWINWDNGLSDQGYLFALPGYDGFIEIDLFFHVPEPVAGPDDKDATEPQWGYLPALMKNTNVKSINVIGVTANSKSVFPLKPMNDRVIIKEVPVTSETEAGIIIPDGSQEKPFRGEVLSVGSGKVCEHCNKVTPLDLVVGDLVLYGKYSGQEFTWEGEKYFILRYGDLFAKL